MPPLQIPMRPGSPDAGNGAPQPVPSQQTSPSPSASPSLQSLVGSPASQSSDQTNHTVADQLQQAAKSLQAAVHVKPELARVIDKFMSDTEPMVARALQSAAGPAPGATPQQSAPQPMMGGQ